MYATITMIGLTSLITELPCEKNYGQTRIVLNIRLPVTSDIRGSSYKRGVFKYHVIMREGRRVGFFVQE